MSFKNNKNQLSYFLRTQSSILNGELIVPYNTSRPKSKKKNNNSNSKTKKNYKKKYHGSYSIGNKSAKKKKQTDENEPLSYKGIDLSKVSGYTHSLNNINISAKKCQDRKNSQINENNIDNIERNKINEKEKQLINEYDNVHKPYPGNINNNENFMNDKQMEMYNKYNREYYINNNNDKEVYNNYEEQYNELNNRNLLKDEYIGRKQIRNNNYINEQQYQNSLPSNIAENEILNNPGESMSITAMDNFTNRNNNFIIKNKNELNDNNNINRLNDIYFKINELKNDILNSDKKDTNNNIFYNYKNNNKKLLYHYNVNNNNLNNFMKNILNKENNIMKNKNKTTDIFYNNNNNDNYFKYQVNNKIYNGHEFNGNKTSSYFKINNYSFLNNKNNNDSYKKIKEPLSTQNSVFNPSNYSLKAKNKINQIFSSFNYNNTYKPKDNLEAHKFFGIQMNENKLEHLLKIIPRHNKENKFLSYNKLNQNKNKQKKQINYNNRNININIFALNRASGFNEEFNEVMPPNIINY